MDLTPRQKLALHRLRFAGADKADHTTISPEVTLDETRRPPDTERES